VRESWSNRSINSFTSRISSVLIRFALWRSSWRCQGSSPLRGKTVRYHRCLEISLLTAPLRHRSLSNQTSQRNPPFYARNREDPQVARESAALSLSIRHTRVDPPGIPPVYVGSTYRRKDRCHRSRSSRKAVSPNRHSLEDQAVFESRPWGSSTNFFATPESKSR
jgi:hypothetical protein